MNLWYLLSFPALLVISLTAVARLNDIPKSYMDWHWIVRRIGFTGSAVYAVIRIALPFTETGRTWTTTWFDLLAHCSWAAVWLTTPNMPPWHLYISGQHRAFVDTDTPVVRKGFVSEAKSRITSEFKALGSSFKTKSERRAGEERRSGKDRRTIIGD